MSEKTLNQLLEDEAFLKKIEGMDEEAVAAILAEEGIDMEKEGARLEATGEGLISADSFDAEEEMELGEDDLVNVAGGAKSCRVYYEGCGKKLTKSSKGNAHTDAAFHRLFCGACNARYKKTGMWYLIY